LQVLSRHVGIPTKLLWADNNTAQFEQRTTEVFSCIYLLSTAGVQFSEALRLTKSLTLGSLFRVREDVARS